MAAHNMHFRDPTAGNKVLWVKFGWSDYYQGGVVNGNFGWLNAAKGGKDEGRGHEAFNFMPAGDGKYYCYVPPQSKEYAPWDDDNTGWTVICLAKNPKFRGIHIVGWYEDATLLGEWKKPPLSHPAARLSKNVTAYDWSYCISSPSAFFVPPDARTTPFSHPSIRQGKYSFLKGPGVDDNENKKEVLNLLRPRLLSLKDEIVYNPNLDSVSDPELNAADPLYGFGSPEHRRKVEKAAEHAVISYFEAKKYKYLNHTKLNCGYDFRFYKGSDVIDVEVKGTSSRAMNFFLTRNEHDAGLKANPNWRLAMVTGALTESPVVRIFDPKQIMKAFKLTPYVYTAREIVESD